MVLAEDLRQAVLQAALQGKLTEQLETDSDVDEMLEKVIVNIKSNRQNSRANRIESIDKDDVPYEIPSSWKWIRLGKIANVIRGLTFSASSKTKQQDMVLVLRGGNIDSKTEKLIYDDNIYVNKNIPNDNQFLRNGDCLIVASSGTKSSIGKSCYIEKIGDEISFGGFMMVVRPHQMINPQLVSYHIKQYRQKIINDTVGYIGNITNPILNNLLIPLPPAEEQQRIVDRINEIMNKIDEYEKIEKELEILKKEFPTNMKDAFLQAAMQGKLTEQLESDSSVDELLALIQKEKKQLIEEKKIYKDKKLVEDVENKLDIDIPNNWRFVNLQEICTQITDGEHKTPNRVSEYQGYYLLSARNILNGKLVLDDVDYVSKEEYDVISKRCNPHRNDILISCSGSVGRCCLISDDNNYVMVRSAAMIHCLQMNNKYIMYAIQSPYIQAQIDGLKKQSVQANLFQSAIASLLIPIPPIEEQQRIVERLDTLLPLCDDLKEE